MRFTMLAAFHLTRFSFRLDLVMVFFHFLVFHFTRFIKHITRFLKTSTHIARFTHASATFTHASATFRATHITRFRPVHLIRFGFRLVLLVHLQVHLHLIRFGFRLVLLVRFTMLAAFHLMRFTMLAAQDSVEL